MIFGTKRVALLAANPAFADLITSGIKAEADFLVFCFGSLEALGTFARVSPIDLMIVDGDSVGADRLAAVTAVRDQPRRAGLEPKLVLLTRAAQEFDESLLARGFDAVVRKPASPADLLAAVRLATDVEPAGPFVDGVYRGPERRRSHGRLRNVATAVRRNNVVQLFAGSASRPER